MKKVYLTENQFKEYLNFLNEEEYGCIKKIGPFYSPQEAKDILEWIRSERIATDSWIHGNYVMVVIERDAFDDDYVDDVVSYINQHRAKMVAESRR